MPGGLRLFNDVMIPRIAPTSGSIGEVPTFAYGISVSLFIFSSTFAVSMPLRHGRVGPCRDYLFGERVYILLRSAAKS